MFETLRGGERVLRTVQIINGVNVREASDTNVSQLLLSVNRLPQGVQVYPKAADFRAR